MSFSSLSEFILTLEKKGELIRIKQFVNPELEISEIADRFSKLPGGGKALLFENTGTGFPVLMNSLGSEERMCIALGINKLDDIAKDITAVLDLFSASRETWFQKLKVLPSLAKYAGYLPKSISGIADCQEVIHRDPDLNTLPVLKTWPFDGGKFFTFPLVHTIDLETGTRNVGMYRMQVFDKNTTGMHWHRHKTGASHFEKYKRAGKIMPVAVALGGDPVLSYCATAPLPDQLDEYIFAGFLRKSPVRLIKTITQDIEVPADADIVLEGFIDPAEEFRAEGPFGDHTGFYSLTDKYPVFHVTCITHRKNAVFPATVVGIPPMEDAWIAKATERIFLWPIKKTLVPEMTDINIPAFGVAHNLTIASIIKTFPGQAEKVTNSLWGAGQMMFNKFMIITDDKEIINNYPVLLQKLSDLDFEQHLFFAKGPLDVLDHSARSMGFGSKMGIDITTPLPEESHSFMHCNSPDILSKVNSEGSVLRYENVFHRYPGIRMMLVNAARIEMKFLLNEIIEILGKIKSNYPRIILVLDENVEIEDYFLTSWVALNNIDPLRDSTMVPFKNDHVLVLDARSKEPSIGNFERSWPNVIVMDDATIKAVDEKWEGLVPFTVLQSPSLRFKPLVKNIGAVAFPGIFPIQ